MDTQHPSLPHKVESKKQEEQIRIYAKAKVVYVCIQFKNQ